MAHKKAKTYKVYKHGEVIYVDFPDKDGHEIRGPHYAVVMTRKDYYKSPLLNVVPLTSKDGGGRNYYLGECFLPGVLKNSTVELQKLYEKAEQLDELHKTALINRKSIEAIESEIRRLYGSEFWNLISTDIADYFLKISILRDEAINKSKEFDEQLTWFEDFSKNTYAIPAQITTIDKKRILSTSAKRKLMENIVLPVQQIKELEKEICYRLFKYISVKDIEDTGVH